MLYQKLCVPKSKYRFFEEITIPEAGRLASARNISIPFCEDADYLLLAPLCNRMRVKRNSTSMRLGRNDILVCGRNTQIEFLDSGYPFIYILLQGNLIRNAFAKKRIGSVLHFNETDDIIDAVNQLNDMITNKTALPERMVKLAFTLFIDIITYTDGIPAYPPLVANTLRLISADYCFLEGTQDIADQMGVTPSHLIRVFSGTLNTTPGKYLEKVRIDKSKVYLRTQSLSIQEIAHLTGYSSANYFAKAFKKRTGISPTQYAGAYPKLDIDLTTEIPDSFYL